jgi:hypothetical protein
MLECVPRQPAAATPAHTTFTGPTGRDMAERQDRIRLAAPHHGIASPRRLLTGGGDSEPQGIIQYFKCPTCPRKTHRPKNTQEEDQ